MKNKLSSSENVPSKALKGKGKPSSPEYIDISSDESDDPGDEACYYSNWQHSIELERRRFDGVAAIPDDAAVWKDIKNSAIALVEFSSRPGSFQVQYWVDKGVLRKVVPGLALEDAGYKKSSATTLLLDGHAFNSGKAEENRRDRAAPFGGNQQRGEQRLRLGTTLPACLRNQAAISCDDCPRQGRCKGCKVFVTGQDRNAEHRCPINNKDIMLSKTTCDSYDWILHPHDPLHNPALPKQVRGLALEDAGYVTRTR
ncbi:6369_t:CDS:2, partial [Acaulospora colombiana]